MLPKLCLYLCALILPCAAQAQSFLVHPLSTELHSRTGLALIGIQTGLLVADGVTTQAATRPGGYTEQDPIARTLLGPHPKMSRMIPLGIGQTIIETWLSGKLAQSHNHVLHALRFLPLAVGIAGNSYGTTVNLLNLTRPQPYAPNPSMLPHLPSADEMHPVFSVTLP